MSKPYIIDVDDLSMAYKMYAKPTDMLREAIFGGVRHDRFWALRDVSLKLSEGERVGIIGHNGAGKSTLLQAIAGKLKPTSGRVDVRGQISSLLSLVPAWNLEETGLENIRFNLLVQGADPARIPRLIEDIVDFTDLGPFIYQPVKTYSAGMSARLSFAIATAIEPEILIVDEVLGAGDGYFAGRAARRMQEMCKRGKALLFVSHATSAVRLMCDTCLWLENGQVRMYGPVETVLRRYEEDMLRQQDETLREGNRRRSEAQRNLIKPEDIDHAGLLRFRLRPEADSPHVTDTHFVKNLRVEMADVDVELPLQLVDLRRSENLAMLDLHSCEWGRMYDRHGLECRTLLPRTGARPGGHVLVKQLDRTGLTAMPVRVTFDSASLAHREKLTVDFADLSTLGWRPLQIDSRAPLSDGWERISAHGTVTVGEPNVAMDTANAVLNKLALKPVEITRVQLIVDDMPALSVDELQPFSIRIELLHREAMPGVSVNLNVIRSDGAYVFYQPSGMGDRNIKDHLGLSVVEFKFDPNPFGFGEYECNVFATDSFNWENCPPSDIYDRSIAGCVFKVNLARPITFGLVNLTVPVEIATFADEPPAAANESKPEREFEVEDRW